jgi:hypothetical protein
LAIRLALLEALSEAAGQITRDLAPRMPRSATSTGR